MVDVQTGQAISKSSGDVSDDEEKLDDSINHLPIMKGVGAGSRNKALISRAIIESGRTSIQPYNNPSNMQSFTGPASQKH